MKLKKKIIIMLFPMILTAGGVLGYTLLKQDRVLAYDGKAVVLDAGHGGHDTGTVYGSVTEKDITLDITKQVGQILEQNGIDVTYTRDQDQALGDDESSDLKQRTQIANKVNARYFISIHVNASQIGGASGFEIFANTSSSTSKNLAKSIEGHMADLNYTNDRGILNGNKLYVIRNTNMPAILIETGFLNGGDFSYLSSTNGKQEIAKKIALGIMQQMDIDTNTGDKD